jgi:hypothetical protein
LDAWHTHADATLADTLLPADLGEIVAVQCAGDERQLDTLKRALNRVTPFQGDPQ